MAKSDQVQEEFPLESVEVSPPRRSYLHVTVAQEPTQIQFGQAQIGVLVQRRLRHIQAQVVIKVTLFLTAVYFILEAINYYY